MIYSFLRMFAVPVMLAGYVLYRLLFKKNKADIKTDMLYVALIIVVYFMVYAWLSDL